MHGLPADFLSKGQTTVGGGGGWIPPGPYKAKLDLMLKTYQKTEREKQMALTLN